MIDQRFRTIIDRIPIRHATALSFLALGILFYIEPSQTPVISWLNQFDYLREFYSVWLILGALIITIRYDPFTFFLGTLPYVVYILLAIATAPATGSWYAPVPLILSYIAIIKVFIHEINGGD